MTVADLVTQRARSSRQSRGPAQQFQRLIAFRPQILRQLIVPFRNGLDTRDQNGRGVARARRLQPLHRRFVVSGEAIEIGVEGFCFRAERLHRRGQPAIGRSKRRREVRQSKQLFEGAKRSVGGGTLYRSEHLLVSVDLGARVEPRDVGESLADVALRRLERLERRDDVRKRRRRRALRRRRDARRISASRRFAGSCRSLRRIGGAGYSANREHDKHENAVPASQRPNRFRGFVHRYRACRSPLISVLAGSASLRRYDVMAMGRLSWRSKCSPSRRQQHIDELVEVTARRGELLRRYGD